MNKNESDYTEMKCVAKKVDKSIEKTTMKSTVISNKVVSC